MCSYGVKTSLKKLFRAQDERQDDSSQDIYNSLFTFHSSLLPKQAPRNTY